jgi:hypothetical protein
MFPLHNQFLHIEFDYYYIIYYMMNYYVVF